MNRRMFIAVVATQSLVIMDKARAQSRAKPYRIALLFNGTEATVRSYFEATKAGLRDFGYDERNVVIDVRYAEGQYERIPHLAAELVRAQPDVIIGSGTPALLAFKKATATIPIVMGASSDPESTGLVASLARPGGNITGSAILNYEMMLKRIELLGELLPEAGEVALFTNPDNRATAFSSSNAIRTARESMRFRIARFDVRSPGDIEAAFLKASAQKMDAALFDDDGLLRNNRRSIAELALKHRIPTCGPFDFAEAGLLLSLGADYLLLYRRAGYFVDKILKGAKPADLPVEQVATFTLVVNRRTARALDLKMPLSIMQRADKVID